MNKNFLLEHGFVEIQKSDLSELFIDGIVRKLHIDIASNDPFMLLGRIWAKSAIVESKKMRDNPERLVFIKLDKAKNIIFNMPLDCMKDILFKEYENGFIELIFNVPNNSVEVSIHLKDIVQYI